MRPTCTEQQKAHQLLFVEALDEATQEPFHSLLSEAKILLKWQALEYFVCCDFEFVVDLSYTFIQQRSHVLFQNWTPDLLNIG